MGRTSVEDSVSTGLPGRCKSLCNLCTSVCCFRGKSYARNDTGTYGQTSRLRVRCAKARSRLRVKSWRRRRCFRVRHVFPRSFPQLLSKTETSCFNAGSEGCGVGHFRSAQTASSTRHIQRITASRPSERGTREAGAEAQARLHEAHGRMDGIKLHQRQSFLIRSWRVRRL